MKRSCTTALLRCLAAVFAFYFLAPAAALAQDGTALRDNALAFLRSQQQADGSFAPPQAHRKTSLVVLSVLSVLSVEAAAWGKDLAMVERGVDYLVQSSSASGDLGDEVFRTESHALATMAILGALEHLRDARLVAPAAQKLGRGSRLLLRQQDHSSSGSSRGGWKMEGEKGRGNDRRASTFALFCCAAARQYGLDVPDANIERAVRFMNGAFKEKADNPDQIGGLSVDAEGLTVQMMSAMGGWVLCQLPDQPGSCALNFQWLARRPPEWVGQIISTAMALLITAADESRLPVDADYRIARWC